MIYLYNTTVKPGLTRKFKRPWTGLYQITRKISDLNCEILGQNNKTQVVHVNRLKKAYGANQWKPKSGQRTMMKPPRKMSKRTGRVTKKNSNLDHIRWRWQTLPQTLTSACTHHTKVPIALTSLNPVQTHPVLGATTQIISLLKPPDPGESFKLRETNCRLPDPAPELCHKML
jgi:hypothetical protein